MIVQFIGYSALGWAIIGFITIFLVKEQKIESYQNINRNVALWFLVAAVCLK